MPREAFFPCLLNLADGAGVDLRDEFSYGAGVNLRDEFS